ncbi:MAG: NUDIX domain-containing protein [Arthrobacter sp.]|jgi:8-oxo-dGTP pyrophosphatase MutT (NUDIX family)|nr:NUDIX domain-containing protein [Arthrobacter sp.]
MTTPRFVLELREKIGHAPLWMPGVKGVVLRAGAGGAEVLLVQRRDNGRWTVPAGILEPGEEPADGIAREVLEETGVVARPLRLVGVQTTQPTEYPNGDRAQYLDVVVALEPVGGDARVNDDENLAVAWRPVSELDDVPPLHRRAIEWARGLDPRYADGGAAGGGAYFVHDGEAKRA